MTRTCSEAVLQTTLQPGVVPHQSKLHYDHRLIRETGKCTEKVLRCEYMHGGMHETRSCASNRIWPPRRDERLSILLGIGGAWKFDWPRIRVLTRYVSSRRKREE